MASPDPTSQNHRNVPHVPPGTKVLAATTATTKSGLPVRLFVSDVFIERQFFALQAIAATDLSFPEDLAEFPTRGVLGYVRAAWTTLTDLSGSSPTLGEFGSGIAGRPWTKSEEELKKYMVGRSYLYDPSRPSSLHFARHRERQDVFSRLWVSAVWKNVASVEFAESYEERKGLATLMYPALASILDKEGIPFVGSGLASDKARAFWSTFASQDVLAVAGQQRSRVVPSTLQWQLRSPLVPFPGSPFPPQASLPPTPSLPDDVTLSDSVSSLVERLYPLALAPKRSARSRPRSPRSR